MKLTGPVGRQSEVDRRLTERDLSPVPRLEQRQSGWRKKSANERNGWSTLASGAKR